MWHIIFNPINPIFVFVIVNINFVEIIIIHQLVLEDQADNVIGVIIYSLVQITNYITRIL